MRAGSLLGAFAAALLGAGAAFAAPAATTACAATAQRAPADARIRLAIDEALRQHQLFGGQTIERNGSMFRVGYYEAEWSRPRGESTATWQRVASFWRSLSESEPPAVLTSAGWVLRSEALRAADRDGTPAELALRESLLRAAIVDTPWSAAFISYLMKTAGFSAAEFAFSDSHFVYVQAALEASAAEAAGRSTRYAFRACDVRTTRPRAGDLLCATRGDSGVVRFDALGSAIAAHPPGLGFPMHCDLVVRADRGGDAKLESIGGNVVQSVTLTRMTLNADKVLSDGYITRAPAGEECAGGGQPCPAHLSRRPWVVLLQLRN